MVLAGSQTSRLHTRGAESQPELVVLFKSCSQLMGHLLLLLQKARQGETLEPASAGEQRR